MLQAPFSLWNNCSHGFVGTAPVGFSNVVQRQASLDVVKNAFALTKDPNKGVQGVYTTPAWSAINSNDSSTDPSKHRGAQHLPYQEYVS